MVDRHPDPDEASPPHDLKNERMTPRLMGRLFVVPLLIVLMIVGSSVLVVLLFGWISTSQQESVDKLVARIEAGSGDKVFGVALLPRDKEVWQAAMELARRLDADHPQSVPVPQRAEIARRLGTILEQARGAEQHEIGREMQQFLLTALGNLGQAGTIDVLEKYATDQKQPVSVRRHAIGALVLMRGEPAARESIPALIPLMDSPEPVLRIAATVAVGALAPPHDPVAIAALTRAYRSSDREVAWNAALALARLGSDAALPLLQDMLTRRHWETQKVEIPGAARPGEPERRLSPAQVESYLLLSIDAAAALGDPKLKPHIHKLQDDPSLQVRDRARKALQNRSSSQPAS
jgi:HEAT repeat protein